MELVGTLGPFKLIGRETLGVNNKIAQFFCVVGDNSTLEPYIIVENISDAATDAGNDLTTLDTALDQKTVIGLNWIAVLKLLHLARKDYKSIGTNVKNLIDTICIFGNQEYEGINQRRQDGVIAIVHSIYSAATLLGTDVVKQILEKTAANKTEIPDFNTSPIPSRYRWSVSFLKAVYDPSLSTISSDYPTIIKTPIEQMIKDIHDKYMKEQWDGRYDIVSLLQTPKRLFEEVDRPYLVSEPTPAKTPTGKKYEGVEERAARIVRGRGIRKIIGYRV